MRARVCLLVLVLSPRRRCRRSRTRWRAKARGIPRARSTRVTSRPKASSCTASTCARSAAISRSAPILRTRTARRSPGCSQARRARARRRPAVRRTPKRIADAATALSGLELQMRGHRHPGPARALGAAQAADRTARRVSGMRRPATHAGWYWRGDVSMDQYANGLVPAIGLCRRLFPERTRGGSRSTRRRTCWRTTSSSPIPTEGARASATFRGARDWASTRSRSSRATRSSRSPQSSTAAIHAGSKRAIGFATGIAWSPARARRTCGCSASRVTPTT